MRPCSRNICLTLIWAVCVETSQSLSTIVPLPDPILDLFDWPRIICRALSTMKHSAWAITSIKANNEIPRNQTTNKTRASVDSPESQGSS